MDGDWGKLVPLWERDKIVSQECKRMQRNKNNVASDNSNGLDKKIRNVVSLISQGHVSKAANRINSFGVADIANDSVLTQN